MNVLPMICYSVFCPSSPCLKILCKYRFLQISLYIERSVTVSCHQVRSTAARLGQFQLKLSRCWAANKNNELFLLVGPDRWLEVNTSLI